MVALEWFVLIAMARPDSSDHSKKRLYFASLTCETSEMALHVVGRLLCASVATCRMHAALIQPITIEFAFDDKLQNSRI